MKGGRRVGELEKELANYKQNIGYKVFP